MANPRIDELRKRLEREPGSRLFAQLAEELRKDGELEEAIRVCREGLQKQPNYPSARMTLGRALFDSGDLEGARVELESVLKGAPDNILAGRMLGECLERQGDAAGALARYKATLALAPGDKPIVERIHAIETGAPPGTAARAVPAPPAPAPAAPAPAPPASFEATLVDVPSPVAAQEAAAEAEPAPIPLSQVDDEAFELERPYEAEPTLVGMGERGGSAGAPAPPAVAPPPFGPPEERPIPVSEAEESFELERPYEAPATVIGAPPRAPAPAAPAIGEPEPTAPVVPPPAPVVEPSPPAFPPPAPAPEAAADAELNTVTLAELYLSQGVMDKAVEVYRQVLERDPHNARARARLAEIEALEARIRAEQAAVAAEGATDPQSARREAIERTIARLEGLLAALRRG